jgi:hypothetical protein
LADAIRQSLKGTPDREERIQRSQAYIRRFQGDNVASQVAEIYQRLVG